MTDRAKSRVALESLTDHPAVRAWDELGLADGRPISIERLVTLKGKGNVYRLRWPGNSLAPVIAKCGHRESILVERFAYQVALPRIQVTKLECYGFLEKADGNCWLFLEDAGGEEYSDSNPVHVALASGWSARLHASTAAEDIGAHLPTHGKDYYLETFVGTARMILEALENRGRYIGTGVPVLESLVDHCTALESRWDEIWNFCDILPKCLLHGDFINKNLRVRSVDGRLSLYVMDWEYASWSVPVEDMAGLDMSVYWPIVRGTWPQLSLETARRAANIGSIMKYSAWIQGFSAGLLYDDIEDTLEDLRYCEVELAAARRAIGM